MATSKNQKVGRGRGIDLGKKWYMKGSDTEVRRVMVLDGGKRRFVWAEVTGPGQYGRHVSTQEIEKR